MNDDFANVNKSVESDLGLCHQNRSTRQKSTPATVHNRKFVPHSRIWGHDFLKRRSPTRKGMQAAERPESHPRKTCASQKGRAPHRNTRAPRIRPSFNPRRHASFRKAQLQAQDISGISASRFYVAFAASRPYFAVTKHLSKRRYFALATTQPYYAFATNQPCFVFEAEQPYFALAASHTAEASRAQASISASWSRLSTF